jgi:hypothetical protein
VASARSISSARPPSFSVRRAVTIGVLLLMAALYVNPVQRYLDERARLHDERAQLAALQREHDRLEAQASGLLTRPRIVLLARECGWIFPGERPLVIQGVTPRDGAQCS